MSHEKESDGKKEYNKKIEILAIFQGILKCFLAQFIGWASNKVL